MKMQGSLFKNHFKMPTTEPETKNGVLQSVGSRMAVQVAHLGIWPRKMHSTRPKCSQLQVQRGRGGAGTFLAGTALNLSSHILDSSLCDWRALSEVSKLAVLSNYSNYAWVVYELKHFYYFEIIWFEKIPKDLKSSHTISRNFNRATVSERKRTVRFFKYDSNTIKFEMASKNVLLCWYY